MKLKNQEREYRRRDIMEEEESELREKVLRLKKDDPYVTLKELKRKFSPPLWNQLEEICDEYRIK